LAVATPQLRANLSGTVNGRGTNLYVLFVAPPASSRKSTAKNYAQETVDRAFANVRLPELASHEGMLEALTGCNGSSALWAVDEFTDMLTKILKTQYMAGFRGMLLELYDRTNYTFKRVSKHGKHANPANNTLCISDLRLSLIGCATTTIFQNIDSSLIGDGLLSRFAIVMPESKPLRMPQYERTDDPITPAFIEWLSKIRERTANVTVKFGEGVLHLLDEVIDKPLEESGGHHVMTKRVGVMAQKVAMLAAAGAQRESGPELLVTLEDAASAIRVAKRWQQYAEAFEARIDETTAEVRVQKCLAILKQVAPAEQWVNRRVIMQRVHVMAKDLREIEQTLVIRGHIDVCTSERNEGGTPSVFWKATTS
jgi:hypothetical protein